MQQPAGSYWTTRRKRKRWQKLVLFLSCLVVFSTTYALILPAITMTEPPLCGLEEHQHDSSCYEVVLNCPFAETASTVRTDEPEATSATFESEPQSTSAETADTENEVFTEATSAASDSEPQSAPTETSVTESETSAEAISAASSEQPSETQAATPHHHTEGCYQKNLICTLPVHQHSDACYQATDSAPEHSTQEPLPQLNADAVRLTELSAAADTALTAHPGETVCFPLSLKTAPILPDAAYSSIRIRLEIVLPLPEEIAAFDLDAMTWLDQTEGYAPSVAIESRLIGETETPCQVLSGYLLLTAEEPSLSIAATEWSGSVAVSIQTLPEQASFALRIHGAVEYNAWDIVCEEHQTTERLTVDTVVCSVSSEFNPTASSEAYRSYCSAVESLQASETEPQAVNALLDAISTSFAQGILSETAYRELSNRLVQMLIFDSESVAEACIGTNWMQLRDSGWFTKYSAAADGAEPAVESLGSLQHTAYAASLATAPENSEETKPSDQQINGRGGTNEADGVAVSKTIEGTDLENVFDITLTVQTTGNIKELINEPDMAVVIVMDISNTMNDNFDGVTRYAAAMEAAEDFLDQFAENNTLGISKVGYVAFNTDAHQIFGLQACTNEAQANALKNTMRTSTGAIINANGYGVAHNRFTNIEGGLKMAQDMLNGVSNQNKFIILLTDGFPTTYLESGYKGYDPYDTTGRFYDHVLNVPCSSGTSYSDEAAIRARNMAASIRTSGTTIFSIGVDVGGQTIQAYIDSSEKLAAGSGKISIVDRTGTTYEIGSATSTEAYKNWLKNSIGSGYYYDSTNTAGLKDAYNQIFEQIKTKVETAAKADWVASDPVPTVLPGEIEFIGFYDKDGTLKGKELSGTYAENAENTASASSNKDTGNTDIEWDLKQSGYTTTVSGAETTYCFTIRYRVRLKNEDGSFDEKKIYDTNGTTTLQYRTVTEVNGQQTISESKTIDFLIPSVHGYLGELTFTKVDKEKEGHAISGAEFTLSHDTESCSKCRGDGETSVDVPAQVQISDADGKVSFAKIPSGHTYTLEETGVPAGYVKTGDTYSVQVAYDVVTVTVHKEGGAVKEWGNPEDPEDYQITNRIYYQLPSTGGSGIGIYVTGGILLLTAAGLLLLQKMHARRKEKEADSSS